MAAVREWSEGMSSDNIKGMIFFNFSSLFIGASFIVKKKGLKKAGASGIRAGVGGYSYLLEPLWWAGMITMVLGEIAKIAAYVFAPAIMVMRVKALGIALKLTFSGMNQLVYLQTWAFTLVVIACVLTQTNYLNKALDTFNTAVVSPIYHVMFTSLTILASVIMFKDWDGQSSTQIITDICGFVTILSGTFLVHKTKDMVDGPGLSTPLSMRSLKHEEEDGFGEGIPLSSRIHRGISEF
ncbi:putative magnesium transporter NIPA2 [Hibiscus syriacus]|uniref:Probable magnesium transporter n=1 Tax=Hibiscus syriacus TaxID=106335 RepID=A0A6A3CFH9_HIBSY|nr:putative magnesium transporter NIPA2 [Hibiscus syriacus]